MLSHPRANGTVQAVSLLQGSNFSVRDCLLQLSGLSFKEPQSVAAKGDIGCGHKTDSYEIDDNQCLIAALPAIHPFRKPKALLAGIDKAL
jgi:hypothetical protein